MELDERIERQYPSLYITLLSVLVGLVLADLTGEARSRMTLWPLDVGTLRTWAQIVAMATNATGAWAVFAHVAISRSRIPSLADTVVVFLVPVPLLIANSLVGLADIWPWFYYASGYLAVALGTWLWQVRMASRELPSFARLASPFGPPLVLYIGIPFYAAAGWLDQQGFLTPGSELLVAMSTPPAALVMMWLFFRDWHGAIAAARVLAK